MRNIKAFQQDDEVVEENNKLVETGKTLEFKLGLDDILQCHGRVCVPDDVELGRSILEEAHTIKLSIHPGMTKMY